MGTLALLLSMGRMLVGGAGIVLEPTFGCAHAFDSYQPTGTAHSNYQPGATAISDYQPGGTALDEAC